MGSPRLGNQLFGSGYSPSSFTSGIGGILSGLFGNSSSPYEAAGNEYQKYFDQAKNTQNPFYNAGTSAIPNFQNWLQGMKDPSQFINSLMSQYQQSPWAKFQTDQGVRAANNAASASGLIGSTPLAQSNAQYAEDISSKDMNNWLQNVLGINTQYGQGQQSLINTGAGSANALTQLLSQLGQNMGDVAYGKEAGNNFDFGNLIGGATSLASMFL